MISEVNPGSSGYARYGNGINGFDYPWSVKCRAGLTIRQTKQSV